MSDPVKVKITDLELDGGTQARASISDEVVEEYAEVYRKNPSDMPPVVAFDDGDHLWLADGFQRVMAAGRAEQKTILCTVMGGGLKEAIIYAAGANATHGLPRSNKDKACAVKMLLAQKEWAEASTRWLAETAKVSTYLVENIRNSIGAQPEVVKARDGKKRKAKGRKKKERDPGDDTGHVNGKVEPNGVVAYDWKSFNEAFGAVVRQIDEMGRPYKAQNSPEANKLRADLRGWATAVQSWYIDLTHPVTTNKE